MTTVEPGQVPLHDVLAAVRHRREAHAAEARVPARMHQHENRQHDGKENL